MAKYYLSGEWVVKLKTGIFFMFMFISISTFSQKKNKGIGVIERFNPKFSYSPPQRDSVAITGLTIALLTPIFINDEINRAGSPWTDFAKAMANIKTKFENHSQHEANIESKQQFQSKQHQQQQSGPAGWKLATQRAASRRRTVWRPQDR